MDGNSSVNNTPQRPSVAYDYAVAVLMGLGVILLIVSAITGNGLILSLPAGLWAAIVAMPRRHEANRRHRRRESKGRASAVSQFRWRVYMRPALAGALWLTACLVAMPKILAPTAGSEVDESAIAAAMAKAGSLAQAGNYAEALKVFEAIDVPPYLRKRAAQRHHNMGVMYARLERASDARTALEQAVQLDPQDADGYVLLGRLALKAGRYRDAVVNLERAVALQPENHDLQNLLKQAKGEDGGRVTSR